MADHLAGWQTFQFTVGKLLFSFCSLLLLLVLSHKTSVPDCTRDVAMDRQCAVSFFYNYGLISFSDCTGNVKYLGWHSPIIVVSLFMYPVFFSSPCTMHSPSPFAWQTGPEPRRKASLLCSQVPDILLATHQLYNPFYLFLFQADEEKQSEIFCWVY